MFRFTIRDMLWLTVVVAVALAAFLVSLNRQTHWEYRIEAGVGPNVLSAVGAEGWELTGIAPDSDGIMTFYFKRPKPRRYIEK